MIGCQVRASVWFLARRHSNTFDAWPSCLMAPGPGSWLSEPYVFSLALALGPLFVEPICFQSPMAFGAVLLSVPFVFVPLWLQVYIGF